MNNTEKPYPVGITDSLPCAIVSFTDDGTIQYVNERLAELLQYNKEDLRHKNIESIFTLPTRIFYQTHFFPLLQLKTDIDEIFISLKAKGAGDVPVLAYARKTEFEGKPVNVCVFVPVFQRKKYEDEILRSRQQAEKLVEENTELVQARQALELYTQQLDRQVVRLTQINDDYTQLSKVISHDLQEPIRKIGVFTDILKRSFTDASEKESRYFEKVILLVERLKQLTQCIEQYVSIDIRKNEPEKITLHETLVEARDLVCHEMKCDDIEMDMGELPRIEGYKTQMRQLFYELIKNSIQNRDPSRELKISIKSVIAQYNHYSIDSGRYKYIDFVKLEFRDTARGFDGMYSEYVFQMFSRLHFDTSGAGFGLALCKKIVETHFGSISCNSTPGEGTVFTILLPTLLLDKYEKSGAALS